MLIDEKTIRHNYSRVLERMALTAERAGRSPDEIRLVVVTKSQPVEAIQAVIDAGARYLGENYADEAVDKINSLHFKQPVEWHMIGHVQRRKSDLVCEYFSYLHSLDSVRLAERLNQRCGLMRRSLPVLLEFNLSGEETKSGWNAQREYTWNELIPDIEKILVLQHLNVCGVMTMPPYFDNPEDARPYFRLLRKLRDFLALNLPGIQMGELSMGMSNDFEIAIQEGATWIRVGRVIMGERMAGKGEDI